MRIKINSDSEYTGHDIAPIESFYLEIEKDVEDTGEAVAVEYLKLRKILIAGLKEK